MAARLLTQTLTQALALTLTCTDAMFGFMSMTSQPDSFSALIAWDPE